jgi:hypothetical protein
MTAKVWGVLALAGMILLAWVFRYETIPVQTAGPVPAAYLVNRWTGTTYMMRGSRVHEVETPIQVQARRNAAFDRFLDEDPPAKTTRVQGPGSKAPNPFDQYDR